MKLPSGRKRSIAVKFCPTLFKLSSQGGKEAGEAEEKQTKKKIKEEKQRKENAPGVSDQRKEGKGETEDEDAALKDLLELHESGFKVSWPSGLGPATARDAVAAAY